MGEAREVNACRQTQKNNDQAEPISSGGDFLVPTIYLLRAFCGSYGIIMDAVD
jgi:hypothetical protein